MKAARAPCLHAELPAVAAAGSLACERCPRGIILLSRLCIERQPGQPT